MKRLAIFASGNGTNAENIIRYFNGNRLNGEVALVICNKPDAEVIRRARRSGVPSVVMTKAEINDRDMILPVLESYEIDMIVLAGFMLMLPAFLVECYHDRIINIHPSLLPKFGGKGMYGRRVHEAVVASHEKETGITVHVVNEQYDEGRVLFQARVPVDANDTPEDVEMKVRLLELKHFPRVIEGVMSDSI